MTSEQISAFGELKTVSSLHSSGTPGIKSIQIFGALAATGGNDGNIQIYNLQDDCVVSTFAAHPEAVESLVWDPTSTRIFSTGTDNVVRCWNSATENDFSSWGMVGELPAHNGHVTSFSLNPCKQFAASTSLDSTWRFYDIYAGQILASLNNPTGAGNNPRMSVLTFRVHLRTVPSRRRSVWRWYPRLYRPDLDRQGSVQGSRLHRACRRHLLDVVL